MSSADLTRELELTELLRAVRRLQRELEAERRERERMHEAIVDEVLRLVADGPDGQLEYRGLVRRVREAVEKTVPIGATVAVVSRGDDALLRVPARDLEHFPQALDGGWLGHYPSSALAAIAHLEALRERGVGYLVVPATAAWWLDHYVAFGRHLRQRYDVVLEEDDLATIVALRHEASSPWPAVYSLLEDCEWRLGRPPAILNWGSGVDLEQELREWPVFAPPSATERLPYLDATVDIVAYDALARGRLAEARRVAAQGVLGVRATAGGSLASATVEWQAATAAGRTAEPVVARSWTELRRMIDLDGGGYVAVLVDGRAALLPGSLAQLEKIFRDRPDAAIVGGKVLAFDGSLVHAGGRIASSGAAVDVGYGEQNPSAAGYGFSRAVDFVSPALLAVRSELFRELGGRMKGPASPLQAALDLCRRARQAGHGVYFQPECVAVLLEAPTPGSFASATSEPA